MEKLKCKICKFESTNLISHISKYHKVKIFEYRQKYGDEKVIIVSDETRKKLAANNLGKISVFSLKYWINKGYTEEAAKREISIRRPTNIKYWINKGYTEEAAKHQLYLQSTKSTGKKSLIEIWGEKEGTKKFNDRIPKCRILSKRCIEYWMNIGYSKEESESKVSENQNTFTLEKCIKKYGEHIGTEIYNKRQLNWSLKMKNKTDDEKIRINKLKSVCSIKSLIEKFGEEWKNKYIEYNLYDTEVSNIIKNIVLNKLSLEESIHIIHEKIKIYDYTKLKSIFNSKIIKHVFNFTDDDVKKSIRILMSMYGLSNRNGIFGTLVVYRNYLFKSICEYKLCLFFEKENIDFLYENQYPNQNPINKRKKIKYDFFIPRLNLYVEYAGLYKNKSYMDKMNLKKQFCLNNNLNLYVSNDILDIQTHILKLLNEKNNND